jgi:hypothetical protein
METLDRAAHADFASVSERFMSTSHEPGSYVTHSKLPELGSGEVVGYDKGVVRIRFASGERSFLVEAVSPHLVVSDEKPAQLPAARKARPKRKAKPLA